MSSVCTAAHRLCRVEVAAVDYISSRPCWFVLVVPSLDHGSNVGERPAALPNPAATFVMLHGDHCQTRELMLGKIHYWKVALYSSIHPGREAPNADAVNLPLL